MRVLRTLWNMMQVPWLPFVIVAVSLAIYFHIELSRIVHLTIDREARQFCTSGDEWVDPSSARELAFHKVIANAADHSMVLIGDAGDSIQHSQWQLQVLASLTAVQPNAIIAVEALPRPMQPLLDRWLKGEIEEPAFRQGVREDQRFWTFDVDTYMPLFRFARFYRLQIVGVAADKALLDRIAETGWRQLPIDERQGISDPAPAPAGYRRSLAAIFSLSPENVANRVAELAANNPNYECSLSDILTDTHFQRFFDAQLVADRSIAQVLTKLRHGPTTPLVIAIIRREHLEYDWGVPTQLASMGVRNIFTLLPFFAPEECDQIQPGIADAVFTFGTSRAQASTHVPPPSSKQVEVSRR